MPNCPYHDQLACERNAEARAWEERQRDIQLRRDLICEKVRDVFEIRKALADQLRWRRAALKQKEYTTASIAAIKIEILQWVLNNEKKVNRD